jgi:hypothetical protein
MTLYVVVLLFAHFFGDWIWQPRWMALKKSSEIKVLFHHVYRVSLCLFAVAVWFKGPILTLLLVAINALTHIFIDWFGWSYYKKRFASYTIEQHFGNYWFYTNIAVDQFLHLAIIFLLFL